MAITWFRPWRSRRQWSAARGLGRQTARHRTYRPRTEWLEERTVPSLSQPELPTVSHPDSITSVNGKTYFFAVDGDQGEALWVSDGTGTRLVKDITPTLPNAFSGPVFLASAELANLTDAAGTLFFTALDLGRPELWKSDGTPDGTERVKEFDGLIVPGNPYTSAAFGIQDLTAAGATAVFSAYDVVHGRQLWESDGTAPGTILRANRSSSFADAAPVLFGPESIDLAPRPSISGFTSSTLSTTTGTGVYPAPPVSPAVRLAPDGPFAQAIAPGGGSETHLLLPATVPSIDGPASGAAVLFRATEGETYRGKIATLSAPAKVTVEARYRALIDWGDGTAATPGSVHVKGSEVEVDGQHTYRQPGSFPVRVHVEADGTPLGDLSTTATVIPPPPRERPRPNRNTGPTSGLVPAPNSAEGLTIAAAFLLPFFWEYYDRDDKENTLNHGSHG